MPPSHSEPPPIVLDIETMEGGDVLITLGLSGLRRAQVIVPDGQFQTLAVGELAQVVADALAQPGPSYGQVS